MLINKFRYLGLGKYKFLKMLFLQLADTINITNNPRAKAVQLLTVDPPKGLACTVSGWGALEVNSYKKILNLLHFGNYENGVPKTIHLNYFAVWW